MIITIERIIKLSYIVIIYCYIKLLLLIIICTIEITNYLIKINTECNIEIENKNNAMLI